MNSLMSDACGAICKTFILAIAIGVILTTLVLKGYIHIGNQNGYGTRSSVDPQPERIQSTFYNDRTCRYNQYDDRYLIHDSNAHIQYRQPQPIYPPPYRNNSPSYYPNHNNGDYGYNNNHNNYVDNGNYNNTDYNRRNTGEYYHPPIRM